jgi:hypothetical protein
MINSERRNKQCKQLWQFFCEIFFLKICSLFLEVGKKKVIVHFNYFWNFRVFSG